MLEDRLLSWRLKHGSKDALARVYEKYLRYYAYNGEDFWSNNATVYEGDIDHRRVIDTIRSAGYDGDLTIEDESLGQFPKEECFGVIKRDIEYVRGLI